MCLLLMNQMRREGLISCSLQHLFHIPPFSIIWDRFKCASSSVLGLTVSNFILFMLAVFSHTVISVWEDKVNPLIIINGNSTGLVSLCCRCAFVIASFLCLCDGLWLPYLVLLPTSKVYRYCTKYCLHIFIEGQ